MPYLVAYKTIPASAASTHLASGSVAAHASATTSGVSPTPWMSRPLGVT